MTTKRAHTWGVTAAIAAAAIVIGGAEAAGTFKEATSVGYANDASATTSVRRSMPNGRTDIIKVMGNTKWSNIELK